MRHLPTLEEKPTRFRRRPQRQRPQKGWQRSLRYYYYRFLRLRGTPDAISRGIAAGVFAGCFPLFGLQTILGVLLAALLRGNKIAAAASTWISNPLTYVPIFAFNFKIGQLLLGWHDFSVDRVDWQSPELLHFGAKFLWALFLGCFIVGLLMSIGSYFISLRSIERLRRSRSSVRNRSSLWK